MKSLVELGRDIKGNEVLRDLAMDVMQTMFTRSQENLVQPMPWGDKSHPARTHKKPTTISDQSLILISAIPQYWEDPRTVAFRYDAIHSKWVEYGTPPHSVNEEGISAIERWVRRKLGKKNQKEARKFAERIAWKIRKYGMDPHPFVRPAADQTAKEYKMFQIQVE